MASLKYVVALSVIMAVIASNAIASQNCPESPQSLEELLTLMVRNPSEFIGFMVHSKTVDWYNIMVSTQRSFVERSHADDSIGRMFSGLYQGYVTAVDAATNLHNPKQGLVYDVLHPPGLNELFTYLGLKGGLEKIMFIAFEEHTRQKMEANDGAYDAPYLDPLTHIKLHVHQEDGQNSKVFLAKDLSQRPTRIRPADRTYVLLHGFTESPWIKWIVKYVEKLQQNALDKGFTANIIVADYDKMVQGTYSTYPAAVSRVPIISETVLNSIQSMGVDVGSTDTVLTGFSLGGQIAGYIGKLYTEMTCREGSPDKVKWIFGLDPAGPLFDSGEPMIGHVLNKDDAEYVIGFHTDVAHSGTEIQLGHADYYANFNITQAGCLSHQNLCDHHSAHEYIIDALFNPEEYPAYLCKNLETFENGYFECNRENVYHIVKGDYKPSVNPNGVYYVFPQPYFGKSETKLTKWY